MTSTETNVSNFHPFEVVGRGSGTQLQMGENLNQIAYRGFINLLLRKIVNYLILYPDDTRGTFSAIF